MADGTLKQLNNAGGLRLIRHQNIVDSLQAYQFVYARVFAGQELKEVQLLNYRDVMCKVFDVAVFETMATDGQITRPEGNPKLFSDSRALHNELLMRVNFVKRNNALLMGLLDQMKRKSIELQKLIQAEYGSLLIRRHNIQRV